MHEFEHMPATAGGPTMRGFLPGIRFHVDAGGGGGGGGDDGGAGGGDAAALAGGDAAGAAADALAGDAATPVVAPVVATPAWHEDPAAIDFIDQRAAQLVEQQLAPLLPLLEQVFGAGDGAGGAAAALDPDGLNPWNENFGGTLEQRFQMLEQKLLGAVERVAAPLAQREQQELVQEGNQRLEDMLADDVARNGDFPVDPETGKSSAKEAVRPLADMFFPAIAERFGATPRAAELAMQKATGLVRAIAAESAASALAAETNRLNTIAGARGDAGVITAGAHGLPEAQTLSEVTARYAPLLRGN